MPIILNTNISSLKAQRHLNATTLSLNKSLERLGTGFRINHAGDDAAGLQIANKLTSQLRGNQQAIQNAQDGLGILSVAETTYQSVSDGLSRIRELTVQFSSDTNSTTERAAIKTEIFSIADSMIQTVNNAKFGSKDVFGVFNGGDFQDRYYFNSTGAYTGEGTWYQVQNLGDKGASFKTGKIQVGGGSGATTDTLDISKALINDLAEDIDWNLRFDGNDSNMDPFQDATHTEQQKGRAYLVTLDNFQTFIGGQLATLGAYQNQLNSTIDNLTVTNENLYSATSRIMDVDIAKETANKSRMEILQQIGTSILIQANQQPSLALQLLQNLGAR